MISRLPFRWSIINIYQVRYVREILGINNVGEVPPAILYLSDGGHIENLGLLALLKRRLKRIIIADGGFCASEKEVAVELLHSLKMAREKLHCSFSAINGRDINEDVRDMLVEPINGTYSRHYRFKVEYYEKDLKTNEPMKVGEGQIILLIPRHPSKSRRFKEDLSWRAIGNETKVFVNENRWGTSPQLTEDEVNRLTLACSECCHCSCSQCCSEPLCGKFPYHVTANQFFTHALFSAYHREGYMASIEAELQEFTALA